VLVIYFLFVETSKRTLEELTAIFQQRRPVTASLKKDTIFIADNDVMEIRKEHNRY
jgi:hypothetical protein